MQTTWALATIVSVVFTAPASAYVAPRAGWHSAVARSAVAPDARLATRSSLMAKGGPAQQVNVQISTATSSTDITEEEVIAAQDAWAAGVVAVGAAFMEGGNFVELAMGAASDLYAYDFGPVLFKVRCWPAIAVARLLPGA